MEDLKIHPHIFIAWQDAWRLRCCPPETLLASPADSPLREHLALCPWCSATIDLPLPLLPASPPPPVTAPPRPGQIRALHSRLAGWGPKSRYYNPPLVLILTRPDETTVLVAQIYGDHALAGPGDVFFPPTPGLQGFAEPWNCYTLGEGDLGLLLGEVEAAVVSTVLGEMEKTEAPLQPGSLLWFFRQMEVETGYYFASQANNRLMTAHESEPCSPLLRYSDPQDLWQDLQNLSLSQAACPTPPLIIDLLAYATADDRLLPLAAASQKALQALLFTVDQGRIISADAKPLTLSFQEYRQGILTVTGSVALANTEPCTSYFWWQTDQNLIPSLPGQSGYSEQVFWAAFPLNHAQAQRTGSLIVRLIQERNDP